MAFSDFEYDSETETITVKSGVKELPDYAFLGNQKVRHVVLPQGIERIGNLAFCNCQNLTSIELGEGLKSVGSEAFMLCKKLQAVVLPQSVLDLGACAFSACPNAKIYVAKSNPSLCEKVRGSFAPNIDTFGTEETDSQVIFKDIVTQQGDMPLDKAFEIVDF